MNIKKSILLRVRLAFLAVVLFAGAILYRIAHVQFVDGDKWRQKAEDINLQYRKVSATRGNIYSDDGSLLATSLPFYRVALDPGIADEDEYRAGIDSLSRKLSAFYNDKSANAYKRMINDARLEGRRYIVLNRRQIGYQEKQAMSTWPIFRKGRMGGGVIFEKVEKRYNPFKNLAGRTIGFLNEDRYGAGLEYSFNGYLEGKNGEALFQKIAGGTWKPVHDAEDIRPEDGYDVVTTIDINIQDVAESALLRQLLNKDAEYGCVVVMEVKTGHIKAIANLEKKDSGYGYGEYYNYAIGEQGLTEPGSTFKLLSMLALLEEGKVNLTDTVDTGDGNYKFYNQTMRDAKYGGYGKLTVRQAFEKSSNVGISRLVDEQFGVDPAKFLGYVEQVGLDKPLGFQLKGEGVPYFKDPKNKKNWYGTTLPWMSIGYEVKLTPLHTLTLYNAVANGGRVVKPMIVERIQRGNSVEEEYDTEVVRKSIASDRTIRQLQELLEGVVERGTARNISNSNYKIAGKTGTAQKLVNGRYTRKYYTSFAGYFPADAPKYSMIIVIDSPKGFNAYGGDVSAPVFKEIADKIYAQDLELNKDDGIPAPKKRSGDEVFPYIQAGKVDELQMICNRFGLSNHYNGDEQWVQSSLVNHSISWKANEVEAPVVPDVSGMTLRDALYVLENKGLKVNYSGRGRVKSQSLHAGANVPKGGSIRIVLG
ncbi:penicillin-binding protein [Echinicola vietnamensis]|uniref:Cell division protein FtsI/penicillin-binding protein 2 n=1 Tax=Echinicola vietnamensis (strain DSM 17526 / LMG 23754 / KMM 6221) TaxID=926556 RepID=L0FV28_ECHVK|nr:penicillin-binding protein [Echinicola vietnamensis]AGA76606.1 cell division protein FtsI/penicillin-binding protein 2 [Echinicola vietnamensis DSM 17526]